MISQILTETEKYTVLSTKCIFPYTKFTVHNTDVVGVRAPDSGGYPKHDAGEEGLGKAYSMKWMSICRAACPQSGLDTLHTGSRQFEMVLSSRISVRLSHDACPGFSARFQSFKRICPRKFKQISQQSSNRFVCTSGGLKGDMLEDPLEKPSTTFEAIKQRHFNPNPRLRQEPGTLYSVQCRWQSNSQ